MSGATNNNLEGLGGQPGFNVNATRVRAAELQVFECATEMRHEPVPDV